MKLKFAIALMFAIACPLAAVAQQAPTDYVLKIKATDLDKLGKALGSMPYSEVAELMASLRQQVVEQQQAVAKSEEKDKK